MKNEELQERLYRIFDEQAPDEFQEILSKTKEKERNRFMEKKTNNWGWLWKFATAFLFLMVLGGGFYTYQRNYMVDSVIDIDVNPSIELKVNKKDKIVKCTALNEDAKEIIQDMDFKGVDIDIALNAIIGSMVTKGYLDDLSNSILISVDNNDEKRAEELRQKLVTKIDSLLSNDKIEGSVLSQTISEKSKEAKDLAEQYHISIGKAELILDVVKNNPLLKIEDLVDLSINEINVLTQGKENSLTTVEKTGNASTKAYIGEEKAKEIALNHANVKNPSKLEVEFDTENGVILYEVEFEDNTYEYDYEINALTGDIITSYKEKEDDHQTTTPNTNNSNYISSEKAKEIALNHAGVKNPSNLEVELDREDNEYSVDFKYNGYEYDYEINATTGKIIKSEKEKDDDYQSSKSSSSNYISSEKAKEIALNHAGVKNPSNLEVELDKEDNEYSVDFKYNGYEYDYEINATTGKIIKSEKERD